MKKKVLHPEWALAHKRKGTELRLLKGKYYLYQVSSKWNPENLAITDFHCISEMWRSQTYGTKR